MARVDLRGQLTDGAQITLGNMIYTMAQRSARSYVAVEHVVFTRIHRSALAGQWLRIYCHKHGRWHERWFAADVANNANDDGH